MAKINPTAKCSCDAPGVFKIFDVSSGHVTRKDLLLLASKKHPFSAIYRYTYGYFVHCSVFELDRWDEQMAEVEANLRKFGLSDAFIKVWKMAVNADCWFIRLDADGTEFEELEWVG